MATAMAVAVFASMAMATTAFGIEPAPEVTVALSASSDSVTVGDVVTVTVTVDHPAAVRVELSPEKAGWGGLSELSRGRVSHPTSDGKARTEIEVKVMALALGPTQLGPIAVRYASGDHIETVRSPTLAMTIAGVRAPGDDEVRDIAGPVAVTTPMRWPFYGGLAVTVVMVAGALAWLGHIRRRRRERAHVIAPDPATVARARLAALEASGLVDAGAHRRAFFEMSDIVRGYLAHVAGVAGHKLTTGEVERALARGDDAAALELCSGWLAACDLVNYAGHQATASDIRRALMGARLIIDHTEARS